MDYGGLRVMNKPFTEIERRLILGEYDLLREKVHYLKSTGQDDPDRAKTEIEKYEKRRNELWDEYLKQLPRIPLSRCPFTGQVVYHSFDPYGIDGLWWNYESSARPSFEEMPPTFCAITGALKRENGVENTQFLVKPGPGVPYVIPRLLENEMVKAVLYSLRVGKNTGYAIVYFSEFPVTGVKWPNHWGLSYYSCGKTGADFRWYESYDDEDTYDFDLKPWIKTGKLQWILFEDKDMVLHSSVTTCPYLDLPGERKILRIQSGKWWV
jgi:hypothetical protein